MATRSCLGLLALVLLSAVLATHGSWIHGPIITCNQSARLDSLSPELTVLQPWVVDGDFDVDGTDFLAWQNGFDTCNARLIDGDANGDADDLAIWHANFGATLLAANPAAVPERTTIALAFLGLVSTGMSWRIGRS